MLLISDCYVHNLVICSLKPNLISIKIERKYAKTKFGWSSFVVCLLINSFECSKDTNNLACVASVSVGFSARPRCWKQRGGGGEARTFLRSPQFSRVQEAKNASILRKALGKRLLRRLQITPLIFPFFYEVMRKFARTPAVSQCPRQFCLHHSNLPKLVSSSVRSSRETGYKIKSESKC